MNYSEEYIIENADTFDWNLFQCDMNFYSQDFADQFKSEIQIYVWRNSKGEYHRTDGPAYKDTNGYTLWCINGIHHREDGPACEYATGDKFWYINGLLHREDGPACDYCTWPSLWCIDGEFLSEEEFNERCNTRKITS